MLSRLFLMVENVRINLIAIQKIVGRGRWGKKKECVPNLGLEPEFFKRYDLQSSSDVLALQLSTMLSWLLLLVENVRINLIAFQKILRRGGWGKKKKNAYHTKDLNPGSLEDRTYNRQRMSYLRSYPQCYRDRCWGG